MIAPLPGLIPFRISTGTYYQMFNNYGEDFSHFFGFLLEAYVGRILQHCTPLTQLLSEEDIRRTYSEDKGKVPDWVILDGTTAVLVECKATRFTRTALTTGSEESIDHSLRQVTKGLRQLHEFRHACTSRQPGLERLHACAVFKLVLVSHEPLYLITRQPRCSVDGSLFEIPSRELFRKYIDGILANEGLPELPWLMLSVDQLEELQPHIATGISLSEVLDSLETAHFDTILKELHSQTKRTYKDSFLYAVNEEVYQRLGIPD